MIKKSLTGIGILIAVGAFILGFWNIGTFFDLGTRVIAADVLSERVGFVEGMFFYGIVGLLGISVGFITIIGLILVYFLWQRKSAS